MKLIVAAVFACVALAAAAPAALEPAQKVVQILKSEFDQQPEGAYIYSFESDDGISKSENGELKTVNDADNKPQQVIVVRGSYSYPGVDGKPITVNYYADETGFHAEGDSIPKPARR